MGVASYFVNTDNDGEYFSARSRPESDYFMILTDVMVKIQKNSTGKRESWRNIINNDNGGAHGISVRLRISHTFKSGAKLTQYVTF
jgi:hypothetical protein